MDQVFESPSRSYRVLDVLSEDAVSTTCRVVTGEPEQTFFLRRWRVDNAGGWTALEFLKTEAAALFRVRHPFIPPHVEFFSSSDEKEFCVVQTFVEGRTAEQALHEAGGTDPDRFRNYLMQGLGALSYLHGQRPPFIHGDLVPANLVLTADRIHLVNFPLIRAGGIFRPGQESGYYPPEQLLGRIQPVSDLFTFGLSMLALASGAAVSQLLQDKHSRFNAVQSLPGGHGPAVRDVLEGLTRPSLMYRIGTAQRAIRILTGFSPGAGEVRGTEIHRRAAVPVVRKKPGEPGRHRKTVRIAAQIVAVFLAMLILILYLLKEPDDVDPAATTKKLPAVTIFPVGEVQALAFHPDGKILASAAGTGNLMLWNAESGMQVAELSLGPESENVGWLGFLGDGVTLAAGTHDGDRVTLIDSKTLAIRKRIRFDTGSRLQTGRIVSDSLVLGAFLRDGRVVVYDLLNKIERMRVRVAGAVKLAIGPGGKLLASAEGTSPAKIKLTDVESEEVVESLSVEHPVLSVAFSRDGETLAWSNMQEIVLWEFGAAKLQNILLQGRSDVLEFSPDAGLIAVDSGDPAHEVELYETKTGSKVMSLLSHEGPVTVIAFSPDGKRLASAGKDGSIRIWLLDPKE